MLFINLACFGVSCTHTQQSRRVTPCPASPLQEHTRSYLPRRTGRKHLVYPQSNTPAYACYMTWRRRGLALESVVISSLSNDSARSGSGDNRDRLLCLSVVIDDWNLRLKIVSLQFTSWLLLLLLTKSITGKEN